MILGLVEHADGRLNPLSLQMLSFGRGLANDVGDRLEAALIGEDARPLADELAAYGVSAVHLIDLGDLREYAPSAWAESVVQLMAAVSPQVVLAAGTDRGHEVMAHVAARTDLPLAANCVAAHPGDPAGLPEQPDGCGADRG